MNRGKTYSFTIALLAVRSARRGACSAGDAKAREQNSSAPVVPVSAVAAAERPIARFIRATGSLMAEEQADVAAETAGRVVAANIERGIAGVAGSRAHPDLVDRDRRAVEGSTRPTRHNSRRGSASPAAARWT